MRVTLTAAEIARSLGKASRCGQGWQACCPAHNDRKPSLLIYDRAEGRVWVKCQAGCAYPDVRAALQAQGLLPPEPHMKRGVSAPTRKRGSTASSNTPVVMPVPEDTPTPNFARLLGWVPTAVHMYLDAQQRPLFLVARCDRDGGKEIRPLTLRRQADASTAWELGGLPDPRPLYGLDRLAARPEAPVLVVEGEKTADAAASRFPDYVVVTWSGGAGAVDKTNWSPLAGRTVTLWPDNDEAGRKAMERVRQLIQKEPA